MVAILTYDLTNLKKLNETQSKSNEYCEVESHFKLSNSNTKFIKQLLSIGTVTEIQKLFASCKM